MKAKAVSGWVLIAIGAIYLLIAALAWLSAYVALVGREGLRAALSVYIWEDLSPFTGIDWLIRLVICAPGFGLIALGDWLKK